jgi:hypothetical protein
MVRKGVVDQVSRPLVLNTDVWIFLAMFAGFAAADPDNRPTIAIFFAILVLYLMADRLLSSRWESLAKFSLLALAVSLFVLAPAIEVMVMRRNSEPYLYAHDGLIQIEEATKFILAGRNPYVEDYTRTPMLNWDFRIGNLRANPALYHNAYLPFFFLFDAPFLVVLNGLIGWFDGRMVFLPMFLVLLVILAQWVRDRSSKYALLLFVALDPLFARFLIEGRNDVFVLFWIVLSIHLLRSGHKNLSLVAFGLACASKLTAWFLIPFYAIYFLQPNVDMFRWRLAEWARSLRAFIPFVATVGLIVVPFLLWQPSAFFDDVWLYPNGTSAFAPYPVSGYGFNGLAQGVGWIPQDAIRSPFEFLEWIAGVPLLALLVWRQVKHNSLPQMWFSFALLIAAMSFFSHVFNDNHIGFVLTLFAIATFTDDGLLPSKRVSSDEA